MDKAGKFHVAIGSTKKELVALYAKEINRVEELEAQLRFLVANDSINDSSIEKEVESLLSK